MTNEQILKQAIVKAVKGGYGGWSSLTEYRKSDISKMSEIRKLLHWQRHYGLIFDHDFAQAFWGEVLVCKLCGSDKIDKNSFSNYFCQGCGKFTNLLSVYKYHLLKMVLSEEPLKYLEKFL